jgi:hypothetical protein
MGQRPADASAIHDLEQVELARPSWLGGGHTHDSGPWIVTAGDEVVVEADVVTPPGTER